MHQTQYKVFYVALYLRLSKDDGDISFSTNGKTESNSIQNQRELLLSYLRKHPEMKLYDEYKDDGYTGTNFDRPEFVRMMDDVRAGAVNCIIVKDLSRFGRDYIECGKFIEKIFPQLNIRFIALNDAFDTAEPNSANNLILPFKNLMNDSYSRDISIKVRSHLEAKRDKGAFVGNYTAYGYIKDPNDKNHLLIDEYAASIVRDIFKWKIEGMSPNSIAEMLNSFGVLSPMEYKRVNGIKYETTFKKKQKAIWNHNAVRRILQNEVYIGVLVQGKRTTPNYKTKMFVYRNENEWARKENAHEAIIHPSDFNLVQKLLKEDTRASSDKIAVQPYSGKLFCGDCGAPIVRKTSKSCGKTYVYYVCSAHKANKDVCSKHSISEEALNRAVLVTIQKQIEVALDLETAMQKIESLTWENTEMKKIDANIEIQNEIIERNNKLRMGVYEDLQKGILTKEEFAALKKEFSKRISNARSVINKLIEKKREIQYGLSHQQNWLEQFREYENITEISRRIIVSLIDKITIYENAEIEVSFRQQDQFADIMKFLEVEENNKQNYEKIVKFSCRGVI